MVAPTIVLLLGSSLLMAGLQTSLKAAEQVQDILMNPKFRIYVNTDIIGVELGGALKNVMAVATGIHCLRQPGTV